MLGAGDAFMGGFLRGWLRGEPHATSATWANACGAFAVSRLLCSPEYPTWTELQTFLEKGSPHRALRRDEALNHIHWATTRRAQPETLFALAIDHRAQLETMADEAGAPRERIGAFKRLAVQAAVQVAGGRPGFGMLLDGTYGRRGAVRRGKASALDRPAGRGAGLAPAPLRGAAPTSARGSIEWPVTQTVKCLAFYHPDDDAALKAEQVRTLRGLYDAARRLGRELLVEIIAGQAWLARRRHDGARARRALRCRHQAGLVEARAAGVGRRVARRSSDVDRARRPLVPRRRASRPRGAGERARGSAFARCGAAPDRQRLRRRPHDLRRRARRPGSPARSTTSRRWTTWPSRFQRLVRDVGRLHALRRRREGGRWRI